MSASDKKKLRAAERAAKLTEKQQTEQKEAKKLKIMTTAFVVVLALMLVFAVVTGVTKTIEGKGIREKNTVALTVNGHEISNAELNYYFIDSVNNFYSQYGSYASLFGLDVTLPLNEQIVNEETGTTWGDDFLTSAIESAKSVYMLNDAAEAEGFTLTEEQQADIDAQMDTAEMYALVYGFTNLEEYLKAVYGRGAEEDTFRRFYEMTYIADAYQTHYSESLTYEDADIREAEAENFNAYSSYSYNTYYLNGSSFDDLAAAEEAAKTLTAEEINTVEALNAAIAALPVNAESTTAASTASEDVLFDSVSSIYAEWVTDASRKVGDITYVPYDYTSTDDAGNETTETRGYYVVLFNGCNDNNFGMSNVRHILITPEGGTYDSTTGLTTYTDEEKDAALATANDILHQWKAGEATEDSFAALANEHSADGDGTTGGLYEGINPSADFVSSFKNWALEAHEIGDTDIIWTEYGYHIMYYCGETEQTYRDYMIETDLRSADFSAWYTALTETVTAEEGDTKYIATDLIMSTN